MPIRFSTLVRQVMVLLLATHAFFMYAQARALNDAFGLHLSTIATSALFAAVLMLPFVWCFGLADLPELWTTHVRPHARWKRDLCARCGYPRAHLQSDRCPECGSIIEPPQPYHFGWKTVRRFVTMIFISLALGCIASETVISLDELAFRREVEQRAATSADAPYSRGRAWPITNAGMMYDPRRGFSSHD